MFKHIQITITKEIRMRTITKLFLGILTSALLVLPTYAGEMTVTGGAKVTYTTSGAVGSESKSLGVANELDFTASGELDNGYAWTYQVQLDGATTANDDSKLTLATDMGTIGFYMSEGGMRQSLAHGVGAMGVGLDYSSTSTFQTGYNVNGYANVQYHTPTGMLPFATQIKVGYVPDMADTDMISGAGANSAITTAELGSNMKAINFSTAPIEGLSVKGDFHYTDDETGTPGVNGTEQGVSGNVGGKYTQGQISVGYTQGHSQPAVASGELTYYENKFYGAQFEVNDQLSISYNEDLSDRNTRNAPTIGAGLTSVSTLEMKQKSYQVAYTTGGATIGLTHLEVDNADYTAGKNESNNIVSLAISF